MYIDAFISRSNRPSADRRSGGDGVMLSRSNRPSADRRSGGRLAIPTILTYGAN
jgi:hypothetical protein